MNLLQFKCNHKSSRGFGTSITLTKSISVEANRYQRVARRNGHCELGRFNLVVRLCEANTIMTSMMAFPVIDIEGLLALSKNSLLSFRAGNPKDVVWDFVIIQLHYVYCKNFSCWIEMFSKTLATFIKGCSYQKCRDGNCSKNKIMLLT